MRFPEYRVLNQERGRAIVESLHRDGQVLVGELARQFQTSQVMIRNDLEALHAHGLLHRTHGGALPSRDNAVLDSTSRERKNFIGEKDFGSLKPRHWSKRAKS